MATTSSVSSNLPNTTARDVDEKHHSPYPKVPLWRLVRDKSLLIPCILEHPMSGSGTEDDPYLVEWIVDDPRNPMNFSPFRKWMLTCLVAFSCLAVSFASSAYTGGVTGLIEQFEVTTTVALLGVSLFVLGFVVGPFLWAPLSEMYGRQIVFLCTFSAFVVSNVGCAASQTMTQLLVLRFLSGTFGSSPVTNSGGVIADLFAADERGLAMSLFACAPFMGPVLGPIAGGFLGEAAGWRWIEILIAIFSTVLLILCSILVPETYAPVLLRHRADDLAKSDGKTYKSRIDHLHGKKTLAHTLKIGFSRPWVLLFLEPIVMILSVYMAIMFGIVYMFFAAFPIVYQKTRGWSIGMSGLAFTGMAVGMIGALTFLLIENTRYLRKSKSLPYALPPEARLPPAMLAACVTPIGLFWFAWTNGPEVHWIVSIISTVLFGFGNVLLTICLLNYLIDSYVIYAASVLAGGAVLRSAMAAAFPLFTGTMYEKLGLHWAATIPAFLSLACVPFPFVIYKYGHRIRARCKYAADAQRALEHIMKRAEEVPIGEAVAEELDEEELQGRTKEEK
jgi:multidrug resistance protein